MKQELFDKLYALNDIEEKQLANHQFQSDFDDKSIMDKNSNYKIPIFTEDFFKNRNLYISKHNRFANYPKHTHTFLEMNYMLSGSATEIIGDQEITLNQGDLLILDVGTTHSINALGKNDILMNIILKNKIDFEKMDVETGFLSKFLLANDQFSKYLIYRAKDTEDQVRSIIELIITEYYEAGQFSNKLLHSYLNSLVILLSRNTDLSTSATLKKKVSDLSLYMLKEISQNFKDLSLDQLAKNTNYNRSYLGSLFKKETGRTFSNALTEQRLLVAYQMLCSSDLSISEIMDCVGISNRTFFFKKFEEKFNKTPKEVRKDNN